MRTHGNVQILHSKIHYYQQRCNHKISTHNMIDILTTSTRKMPTHPLSSHWQHHILPLCCCNCLLLMKVWSGRGWYLALVLLMVSNVTLLMVMDMVLLATPKLAWSENDMVSIIHILSVAGCLCPQRQQYQHSEGVVVYWSPDIGGGNVLTMILIEDALALLVLIKHCCCWHW